MSLGASNSILMIPEKCPLCLCPLRDIGQSKLSHKALAPLSLWALVLSYVPLEEASWETLMKGKSLPHN